MTRIIKKIYRSCMNGYYGISQAYSIDESVRLEWTVGAVIYVGLILLLWPLSGSQLAILLLSYFTILITELINTSIETLLQRLHPVRHHLIGISKDIAAGAVFLSFIFAICIVTILILSKFDILVW